MLAKFVFETGLGSPPELVNTVRFTTTESCVLMSDPEWKASVSKIWLSSPPLAASTASDISTVFRSSVPPSHPRIAEFQVIAELTASGLSKPPMPTRTDV